MIRGFLILMMSVSASAKSTSVPEIPVNRERMFKDVEFLTTVFPPRNVAHVASLNRTADYIHQNFKDAGCRTSVQDYRAWDNEYKNVICSFGPEEGERIVVGAHYDVAGDLPGADDNASGVAGILETARLIHQLEPDLKYRVDIVAYSLEEPPSFRTEFMGSYVHARSLADSGVRVKAMICLEMIGYFNEEKGSQDYPVFFLHWLYPEAGNFIAVVGKWGHGHLVRHVKQYLRRSSSIEVCSLTGPRIIPGLDFSDHMNYWKFGYPAIMITDTAFNRNPNYHEHTDTIETIDFDRMVEVVKGVYWAVVNF
jgi:hypothetical protein